MEFKRPLSVLVVIHTPALEVALLERSLHPGFWQSVTGSQEGQETLGATAMREAQEETGIVATADNLLDWRLSNCFEIMPQWRHRYAPDVTHNIEHVFSLCVPETINLQLAAREHSAQVWLPYEAAAARCFSWTNRDAILMLPHILSNQN
jgi:dATP pyrophosphohydrolase